MPQALRDLLHHSQPAGFVGIGCPEALLNALRSRFDDTGSPRNLGVLMAASTGDFKGRGVEVLAVEGLVSRLVYGWTGSAPGFLRLVRGGTVQAWNLPLGVVSHIIRDVAARRPGPVTHVGLGTFVDPREGGGRLNAQTSEHLVQVVTLGGRELLWYKAPAGRYVALLRGSTADEDGNVSMEGEALVGDQLHQAMAARNSGGLVLVQVSRVVAAGSLPARAVHLPAALVDKVVMAPLQLHWQSFRGPEHDGSLSGEIRVPLHSLAPLPLDARRIIAHRAMLEIDHPHCLVNLGVGMPEGVARMVATHADQNPNASSVTLTTEAGAFGGIPGAGLHFGASHNPSALVPMASMIDFYNGSGVDLACLGMAEMDGAGNVNVSNFGGGRMPGCGGFIDISQTAKKVAFVGTFTSGGLRVAVDGGRLKILEEGRTRKFRRQVLEKTFAGASGRGRTVLYITERAVFRLVAAPRGGGGSLGEGEGGCRVEVAELAPGVVLARDVLAHMDFNPLMPAGGAPKLMDPRIFSIK